MVLDVCFRQMRTNLLVHDDREAKKHNVEIDEGPINIHCELHNVILREVKEGATHWLAEKAYTP